MKLTPLDIHHKEFRTALRGYNQEEVDGFLDEVADEFERLFKENIDLSERIDAANERIRDYADMEKTLHNTMLAAQQSAEEIQSKARKEAELLVRNAQVEAQRLIQDALAEKQRTIVEYQRIKQAEDEFRTHFRHLLEEYLKRNLPIETPGDVAEIVAKGAKAAPEGPKAEPPARSERPTPAAAPVTPPPAVTQPPAQPPAADVGGETAAMPPQPAAPVVPETPAPVEPAAEPAAERPTADRPRADRDRPPARAGRRSQGRSAASDDAPTSGTVQSLTLGEVEDPDLGPEPPSFEEPSEFRMPSDVHGEHDEDLDIEQID